MKNKKFKLLFGLIVVLALSVIFASVAFAADDDEPQLLTKSSKTTKGVTTITLNVTGDADVTESKLVKANVLVVFDTSNSMTDNRASGTTGPYRADAGEYAISQFAHKLFTMAAEGGEGSSVQMALITFNSEASTVQNWTSTETDITGKLSADGTEGSRKLNNVNGTNYYARGTNWEAAMVAARTAVAAADSDPTFVLFFTDGTPSKYLNDSGAVTPAGMTFYNDPEDRVMCAQESMPAARNVDTYDTAHDDYLPHPTGADASVYSDNTTLYGIYAWGDTSVAGDYLDDVIYYAKNGSERTLASGQTAEDTITDGISDQYYPANNTDALTTAINSIFDSIASAVGISEAAISDGTTSEVTTTSGKVSSLLKVDEDSYKYYLAVTIDANGKYTDNDAVEWTVTRANGKATFTTGEGADAKSAEYELADDDAGSGSPVKIKWPDDADTAFYPRAPKAELKDSAVDWDLTDAKYCPLLNGVTYYYSFDCVPSQETNDLIAALKNGDIEYADTDDDPSNDLDPAIAQYIVKNGDNYSLKTNTEATMTYKDTREENPQTHTTPPVENPKPIPAEAEEVDLQKLWYGSYVNSQGLKEEEQDITLLLVCDEEDTASTTNKNDSEITLEYSKGHKDSVFISIGSMSYDSTGKGKVLVNGHDYRLKETGSVSYHWELIADVMHPMSVNGTVKMLVNATLPEGKTWPTGDGIVYAEIDGTNYYKIDGKYFTDSESTTNTIEAKNYRRADINLTKEVVGDAPKGAEFEFEATLKVPDTAPTGEQIWFSVAKPKLDADGKQVVVDGKPQWDIVTDATVTGATAEDGNTGYWYCDSETKVTFKIQAGWNVRFTNVLSGTEYDIVEKNLPKNFYCTDIAMAYEMIADDAEVPEGYEPEITLEDKDGNIKNEISGSAVVPANSYTITYTDTYQLSTVQVVKTFNNITEDDIKEISGEDGFTATVKFEKALTYKGADEDIPEDIDLTIPDPDAEPEEDEEIEDGEDAEEEAATDEITVECKQDGTTVTWTIKNLPVGLNVVVEEDTDSADAVEGFTLIPAKDPEAEDDPDDDTNYSITTANTYGADGEADTSEEEEADRDDTPTAADAPITLNLINNYEVEKGYLQITKEFEGVGEDAKLPASVKVTIKGEDGKSQSGTITADDDEYVLLIEVPTGTYTVEESSAPSISGYKLVKTTYEPVATEGEVLRAETDEAEEPQFATIEVTVKNTEEAPAEVTITNEYKKNDNPPIEDHYWLYYVSNGGTEYDPELYPEGQVVNITYEPIRPGYTFEGWYSDPELTKPVSKVTMNQNHTVYAKWSKTETPGWLNDDDHYAYMIGYPDGLIQPNWNITRAEVATIFFRLLREEVREEYLTSTNSFSDVQEGQWFNTAISTVADMGIVTGYPDGTFKPNANITRAEFATIAARFDQQTRGTGDHFTDLDGHWAKEYIERAAKKGWVTGYPDGTFRPENLATRAEVATLVNRVLNRDPESPEDLLEGMVEWPDNMDTNAWYYMALQEASNTHDYERETKPTETWTQLLENPDWTIYNH